MIPHKTLTVNRYVGEWDDADGDYKETLSSTFTVSTSVQVATPVDINTLPEGEEYKNVKKIFPNTLLQTGLDRITYGGVTYRVVSVGEWQNSILPHYTCMMSEEIAEQTPGEPD